MLEKCGRLYENLVAALSQRDPGAAQHCIDSLLELTDGSRAPLAMMLRGQTLRICATLLVQRGELDAALECMRVALELRRQLGECGEGKCLALDLASLPLLMTRGNPSAGTSVANAASLGLFFLRLLGITASMEAADQHVLLGQMETIPLSCSETQRITLAALGFGVGLAAIDGQTTGAALAWFKQSARLLESLRDIDAVYLEFGVDLAGHLYASMAFERQRGQDIIGMRAVISRFERCLETMGVDAPTRRRHAEIVRANAELNVAIDRDDDAGIRECAKELLRVMPRTGDSGSYSLEMLEALASGRRPRMPRSSALLGDPGREFRNARDPLQLDMDGLILESIKALAGSDRQLRWRSVAMLIALGGEHGPPHRAALGIFFGKLAIRELLYLDTEVLGHGYARITPFDDPLAARAIGDVLHHLVARGRLGEAQRLQMLLDAERARIPSAKVRDADRRVDDECPLTSAERQVLEEVSVMARRLLGGWRPTDLRERMERLAMRLPGADESPVGLEYRPPSPDTAALRIRAVGDRITVTLSGIQGERAVHLDQRTSELNKLVYRTLLSLRRRERAEGLALCQALYDLLLQPFADELQSWQAEILVLEASGALRHVPFAVFHDGERYLIERYSLVMHPGLVRIDANRGIRLPIRGVSFAVSQFGELPALPAVKAESELLCDQIRKAAIGFVERRLNHAVTAEAIQSLGSLRPTLLHIATHFETHAADAGLSGFVLTDGSRYTLKQLAQLDLRSVDLALLTGCQTRAVSDFASDTGINALDTLLLRMGVGSVISTAWPVRDATAHRILRGFIDTLCAGSVDQARALQRAILSVGRDPSTGLMGDPLDWGAYVLSGGWAGFRDCG